MAAARGTGRRAYWRRQIEAHRRSGLSQAAFCAQEGLRTGTLSFWKWKLGRETGPTSGSKATGSRRIAPPPAFVPVQLAALKVDPAAATLSDAIDIELRLGAGYGLRMRGRVDPGWLAQVLWGLEGRGC